MPLQRILLSLLSLFEHAMLESSVLALLFKVKIDFFLKNLFLRFTNWAFYVSDHKETFIC